MRRYSLKRQKLNRTADEWRRNFRESIGACDACGDTERLGLHELGLARGTANRVKFLMEPCGLLCLCNANPATGYEGCHEIWDKAEEIDQLALLYHVRDWCFDLPRYLFLTREGAPDRITAADVYKAHRRLTREPRKQATRKSKPFEEFD